jgi:hypothetical protein
VPFTSVPASPWLPVVVPFVVELPFFVAALELLWSFLVVVVVVVVDFVDFVALFLSVCADVTPNTSKAANIKNVFFMIFQLSY